MKKHARTFLLLPLAALAACGGGDAPEKEKAAARPASQAPARPGEAPAAVAAGGDTALGAGQAPAVAGGGQAAAPGGAAAPAGQPGAPAAAAPAQSEDRAAEILTRVERAAGGIRSMEADFSQTLTIPLLNQTQRSAGKLYQRKPDRFLMRFSDPAGDVIVADGRHFWMYYPSTDRDQVIRTGIAAGGQAVDLHQQFLANANQRFVATLAGEETVGGQPVWVLNLVPRQRTGYRSLRIWVDKDDHMVRRFEMTEENDSGRRVELRNVRTNHSLSDALFSFTPPAGAQVIDQ
ncbi:MAG TPA: outer membrane lipoprotein chaperone LolA [Longimicrobium sp.]|nr:outer membrane lipoprotein chaperone LolA [Longimicrobium sp.]